MKGQRRARGGGHSGGGTSTGTVAGAREGLDTRPLWPDADGVERRGACAVPRLESAPGHRRAGPARPSDSVDR